MMLLDVSMMTAVISVVPSPPRIDTCRSNLILGLKKSKMLILNLPNVTDETRAGERGVSPFELLKMLSGEGTYDSGHIPRVVLWRFG
jgi:hypothetical protein